jgi:6-phosphogluconate dehydrogenase
MQKSDIGLIGLAVMGENLVLNMESKGYRVSVYNRTPEVTIRFTGGRASGKNIAGFENLEEFAGSLALPRKVMMMVRAGKAVDELIDKLLPLLDKGDIIIDGGNSDSRDTERRTKYVEEHGLLYVGSGISGGEEGALNGPSIMPGGSERAWPYIKEIFSAIAAKAPDGTSCTAWMGRGGAGHFVKMVHNGIEYGDMQLISEAYSIMKNIGGLDNDTMSSVFDSWNRGKLDSYLIEITSAILAYKNKEGEALIDKIQDTAGQKGTGKLSVFNAMELGIPLNLIATAVSERSLSARKGLRLKAESLFFPEGRDVEGAFTVVTDDIHDALYASKLVSYSQGFDLLAAASAEFGWNLDLASIAKIWRNGCIIRSSFLNRIADAYAKDPALEHLLFDSYFNEEISNSLNGWKNIIVTAAGAGVAIPAFSSAFNYFHSITSGHLPANLLQAQRDYFGAHTFERTDRPAGEFFHENWTGEGGDTVSGVYNV